jgi:hypothetical protein
MDEDLEALAEEFRQLGSWMFSPLYGALGPVVAEDPAMLEVVSHRRPGQVPVSAFFAAVHYLLLSGVEHELREFYPSVFGNGARTPAAAGPALRDFFRRHQAEIDHVVSTRLVQKHVVKRSALLRLGMWAIGLEVTAPVHLVEVGASAGVHLRFDRYRYDIGGAFFGDPTSPVFIQTEWRADAPVPDLDVLPRLASVTGIDLHPIDALRASERQWLRALVWPEELAEGVMLDTALSTVAHDPPRMVEGDVIDVGAKVAASIPEGEPRVVFHAATRLHVPPERVAAFDAAINAFGEGGPLFHLSQERADAPNTHPVLALQRPGAAAPVHLALTEGYANWIEPLDLPT